MIDRPDVLVPDAYVRAVADQALMDLLGRASRELDQSLAVMSLAVVRDRVPEGDYGAYAASAKGKARPGHARPGHARVRFHETIDKRRFLFELEARFSPDAINPGFAGFSVEGQVRDPGGGRLVAEFRHWVMNRGPSHWSEPFETAGEQQQRLDVPAHWEVRPDAGDVGDLGSLLAHLRRRYGLEGGYVATADGNVIAQDGQLDVGEVPGLVPLLSHDRATIQSFMAMVTIPLMPYSVRAGQWMAWFAVPSPSLFVVLLRKRPMEAEQPDDWGMLSEATELAERRVAERMLFELRDLVAALGYQLTRSP